MSEPVRAARDYAQASLRDLTTHYLNLLDRDVRARLGGRPSSIGHALDRLAVSEAISRYVRNGRQVDVLSALKAGASWQHIGDVLDVPVEQLRREFREWVDGQRGLYDAMQQERPGSRPIGMSPAHGPAAPAPAEPSPQPSDHRHGRAGNRDDEWEEFLGQFERRKVSTGTSARAFCAPCCHEHACVRCSIALARSRTARPADRHPRQPVGLDHPGRT